MSNHSERWAGEYATPTVEDVRRLCYLAYTVEDQGPEVREAIGRVRQCLLRADGPDSEQPPAVPFEIVGTLSYDPGTDTLS